MWDEEEELEVVPTSGASKNPAMCYPSSGWNHQNARPSFILCAVNSPSFGSLLVNDNWGGGVEGMRPTTTNEGTFLYISPVQTLYGFTGIYGKPQKMCLVYFGRLRDVLQMRFEAACALLTAPAL